MRLLAMMLLCMVSECSDEQPQSSPAETSPTAASATERPPDNSPVAGNVEAIREMIRQRFGAAVARTVKVEVEDDAGLRVRLMGEVPSEQIRQDLMREVSTRVQGIKYEDFNLDVAGPIPLIASIEAPVSDGQPAIFSPDLRLAATFRGEIWDLVADRRLNQLNMHEIEGPIAMTFSPDGKLLATAHNRSSIILWDMPLGSSHRVLQPPDKDQTRYNRIVALAFSPDGKRLAGVKREHGEVHLWDVSSGASRVIGSHLPAAASHQMSENYLLSFLPDGKTIVSVEANERAITLWDVEARSRKDSLPIEKGYFESLAITPDGKMIAAGREVNRDPTVVLWELPSKNARRFMPENGGFVKCVAFSPDGKTLATWFANQGVILWDVASGKQWQRIHTDKVGGSALGLAFSPDGTIMATAGNTRPSSIRLWNVSSRPGATGPRTPSQPPPLELTPRDDQLQQDLTLAVRAAEPNPAMKIDVELLPDGSVRLSGTVSHEEVKRYAERIAQTYRPKDAFGPIPPRTVINELQVAPRPDRGPPIRGR